MKSYLFSLGDTNTGAVGFCARITAETPEQALQILKDSLPESKMVRPYKDRKTAGVEYIEAYFNPEFITVEDIEDEEDEELESGICECGRTASNCATTYDESADHADR